MLDITQAADVRMGLFYNHLDSKEQLLQAALSLCPIGLVPAHRETSQRPVSGGFHVDDLELAVKANEARGRALPSLDDLARQSDLAQAGSQE